MTGIMKDAQEMMDFLIMRNVEWQNVYAFEAGEPLWTDAQIERVYGKEVLAKWKQQTICKEHGIIIRDEGCGFCQKKQAA